MKQNIVDINEILDRIINETGIDQKELAKKLGYNEAYLSQARKEGTKKLYKILENYEQEFRKSKNLNPKLTPILGAEQNWKDKYIALLEKTVEDQDKTKEALERELQEFKKQFTDWQAKIDLNLKELNEFAITRAAYLKTVLRSQILHRAKTEKVSIAKLDDEIDIILDEEMADILKSGTLIVGGK